MEKTITLQDEKFALINYINVKNPGPIIRAAVETRIMTLEKLQVYCVPVCNKFKKIPVVDLATKKTYKSIKEAADCLEINYYTLKRDIDYSRFKYNIYPIV